MAFHLNYRLSLGRGFGSITLAQILYSDQFTYTLDESGNSIVTNQGSGSDMLMCSGRYLDLVNQATTINTIAGGYLTYFNITTNVFVCISTTNATYTFDNIKVNNILASTNAPSASDIAKINSNPNLLGALALNNTIPELDWVLDGTQKYYPCMETADALVYDAVTPANTSTISNYTTIARKKSHNKGIQTTAFTLDAVGVPMAYSTNQLNWDGSEYGNMQFMPPSDKAWEMDLVITKEPSSAWVLNGAYPSSSTYSLMVGQDPSNIITLYLGGIQIGSVTKPAGWHHVRVEFNGAGGGRFVVDNITIVSYSSNPYTYSVNEKFFIGGLSRGGVYLSGYTSKKPTGYFKYVEKVRTTEERNADYAEAKLMHPTLP